MVGRRAAGERRRKRVVRLTGAGVPIALGVAACLAVIPLLARSQPPPDLAAAQAHFDAGYRIAATGDFLAAGREMALAAALARGDDLEVRARYQEAICYQAAGDVSRAARLFQRLATQFPDHHLAMRALARIEDMHAASASGTADSVPTDDPSTTLGAGAPRTTHPQDQCGPQALAHALGLLGVPALPEVLAAGAGTTAEGGSTFAGLADAAAAHGVQAQGLLVDALGLRQVPLPALAWVDSDHFVVIQRVTRRGVTVWDPLDAARGKPLDGRTQTVSFEEFGTRWQGYVLALGPARAEEKRKQGNEELQSP